MEPALWIVALTAILSGFFALNNVALHSFSRARLETAFPGSLGRRRLEMLEHHLDSLRLTASLCRTMANLFLVAAMVRLLADNTLDWSSVLSGVVLSGALIALIGVAIPHAWASSAGEQILSATLPAMMMMRYALHPVIWLMRAFHVPVRRLSGMPEDDEEEGQEARHEILAAAADGAADGSVEAHEVEMIQSVMELDDTDAAEIMTPRTDIFALPAETPWEQAVQMVHQAGHTRVPVYHDSLDNITGILYAKDLLRFVDAQPPSNLQSICRKPFVIPETKPLDDLLREFKARKVHVAIVLDEYGGTAGLVTIEDVLEEIVGDISDEYDEVADVQLRRINETTAEVDGRLRVDELNHMLELDLPEDEDYDTVAGFVVSRMGYIPRAGETLTEADAEFGVLDADERKITKLRVRKLPPDQEE